MSSTAEEDTQEVTMSDEEDTQEIPTSDGTQTQDDSESEPDTFLPGTRKSMRLQRGQTSSQSQSVSNSSASTSKTQGKTTGTGGRARKRIIPTSESEDDEEEEPSQPQPGPRPPVNKSQSKTNGRLLKRVMAVYESADDDEVEDEQPSGKVPNGRSQKDKDKSSGNSRSKRIPTVNGAGPSRPRQNSVCGSSSNHASKDKGDKITNTLFYICTHQDKKHVIKRADIIKVGLNNEKDDWVNVLKKVKQILEKTFGIILYAYNDDTGEVSSNMEFAIGFGSYITSTKLRANYLMDLGGPSLSSDWKTVELDSTEKFEHAMKGVLVMCLSSIFMKGLENGVDEGVLWAGVAKLNFKEVLNLQEAYDFRKFMKTHLVKTLYLRMVERIDEAKDRTTARYYWGARAHLEFTKWEILMFVCKRTKKDLQDFPTHLHQILDSSEKKEAMKQLKTLNLMHIAGDGSAVSDMSDEEDDTFVG